MGSSGICAKTSSGVCVRVCVCVCVVCACVESERVRVREGVCEVTDVRRLSAESD